MEIETGNCPKCGNKVYHNQGISNKTGKPYENYKCGNKSCDYIKWLDISPKTFSATPSARNKEPDWNAIRQEKSEGLAKGASFKSAVDVAIALFQKGEIPASDILLTIKNYFAELKKINNKNGK